MSLKGTTLPAYNPALPDDEKEKVIQESLRQIAQGFMGTGCKLVASRTLTQSASVTATAPALVGALTTSFVGTDGFTEAEFKIPFTLAGGANLLSCSLWLDDQEVDRQAASVDCLTLHYRGTPPSGNHTLQVRAQVNAGTATLFSSTRWGNVSVKETLL